MKERIRSAQNAGLEYVKIVNKEIGFRPCLNNWDLEYLVDGGGFSDKDINNNVIYGIIKRITACAHPDQMDKFDKRWHGFYLPLRRSGRIIIHPLSILLYQGKYFVSFHHLRCLCIGPGKEVFEKEYIQMFKDILRFIPVIRRTGGRVLSRTVPRDVRTGKVKGRYILRELMPRKERERILGIYLKHARKNISACGVSLNEYLETAALCYRSAYGRNTQGLSVVELYNRWADGRDGGMLSIKDPNDKKEFERWQNGGRWIGAHPFEIVFSWHRHGIHLYPPSDSRQFYLIHVTNYAYARDFIKMVKALIRSETPFQAGDIEEVLDYLSGDTDFTVNDYDEHSFNYIPSKEYKKRYYPHIRWDALDIPKWK